MLSLSADLFCRSQHFLVTTMGEYELVEFIVLKVCCSHRFTSCLDLLLPSFLHCFASCLQWILQCWICRLELHEDHKGFILIELVDNIILKVCCSYHIWILLLLSSLRIVFAVLCPRRSELHASLNIHIWIRHSIPYMDIYG